MHINLRALHLTCPRSHWNSASWRISSFSWVFLFLWTSRFFEFSRATFHFFMIDWLLKFVLGPFWSLTETSVISLALLFSTHGASIFIYAFLLTVCLIIWFLAHVYSPLYSFFSAFWTKVFIVPFWRPLLCLLELALGECANRKWSRLGIACFDLQRIFCIACSWVFRRKQGFLRSPYTIRSNLAARCKVVRCWPFCETLIAPC